MDTAGKTTLWTSQKLLMGVKYPCFYIIKDVYLTMPKKWKIIYYETKQNESEVYQFIETQKDRNKAKILSWLSILETKGPLLPRPYADLLKDGIHELRIKLSGNQIRILYFFCYENYIILTNSFSKNKERVPEKEINKAKKCRTDFLKQYPENKLRRDYNENI